MKTETDNLKTTLEKYLSVTKDKEKICRMEILMKDTSHSISLFIVVFVLILYPSLYTYISTVLTHKLL